MKKYLCFAILFVFINFGVAHSKDLSCVSTLNSQVCVGESHDSVITKLPKSSVLGQSVTQNQYGPEVRRDYNVLGKIYTITFGRTDANGPHRVLRIEEK